MLREHIASQIYANFGFEPTFGQKKIIENLSSWLSDTRYEDIFILNGYAGTGKTSIIGALVKCLKQLKIKSVLLAPTGRAAKVIAEYADQNASTIHKKIYRQKSLSTIEERFTLDVNRDKDVCFIVDEASMIGDYSTEGNLFGSGSLLDDLIKYVRSGTRCRLMIVGDNAQLPPVGHDESPALDRGRMEVYGTILYNTMDEVMRQSEQSGILFNATMVRCMLENNIFEIPLFETSFPDIRVIGAGEVMEAIEECYSKFGVDQTIVVTRSNKRANRYNEGIRRWVRDAEDRIDSGDRLMIVKNNYYYTDKIKDCPISFIANGDIARLKRIRRVEQLHGFEFAQAELIFDDYDSTQIDARIILDTLASEAPSLTRDQQNQLFTSVCEDYADLATKAKRYKAVREDGYFNALQIKFAYAVTCHKAQGGQWSAVFVDRLLFGDEGMNKDMMRWLYTALTRATERLYIVNFDERFFAND